MSDLLLPIDSVVCGSSEEVLSSFPDSSIDLCVTSPPYDSLRNYNGYSFDSERVIRQLYRVLKPGGVVVWIIGDAVKNGSESGSSFEQFLQFKDQGFRIHDTMIYEKKGIRYPDTKRYYQCFEYMTVFSKGSPKTVRQIRDRENLSAGNVNRYTRREKDGTLTKISRQTTTKKFGVRRNIWSYDTGIWHTAPDNLWLSHPAVMPLRLAEDHISTWSNRGDVVLDVCCGSGQVCLASLIHDRRYIGIDCSAEYVDLANRRIDLYQRTLDHDTLESIITLEELWCEADLT
ncbi:DNA-methyltransferase [Bremerella sp. T1]|uniref:DNA-methyltransferase n=1 Tax=Bremerella sp. TYQ1 TaxID=3119568 RepID=UPI001CD01974|nr:site-specific DNA-methyltransferase [Bremerella volcania]UBM35335.1 site-specific DNA-methyltransferase [Bremerella volcania]